MNTPFSGLQTAAGTTTNRISRAFQRFLDAQINIASGVREDASVSHNHLRDFLSDEHDRDVHFPRILREVDSDFLGGSFARHTKIWPLNDIDVYFPIDGSQLVYSRGDLRLPYTVASDDATLSNALIQGGDRWTNGIYISGRKLIDGFAKVLRRHYNTGTRVRRAGEAVTVKLTDVGFDVVPCFCLKPTNAGGSDVYVIPDGKDGWIETNPRLDNFVSAHLQRLNNKAHRPGVKLLKWWNENQFGAAFPSYYIELAIMTHLLQQNAAGTFISSVSDAVAHSFEGLRAAASAGDLKSWIMSARPLSADRCRENNRRI